jgi:hypothetical protein
MSYERFRATINAPALIAVAEHWNAARSGRSMPAWRQIDPAAIKTYLPIVWSWRWDAALGTFIGRLAGEEIRAVMGLSIARKRLQDCFPPAARDAVFARYKRVIDEPAIMHSRGKIYALAGDHGWGERVVLPLAADGSHGDGVLGATVYQLGLRPTSGEVSIDHLNEAVEFYSIA